MSVVSHLNKITRQDFQPYVQNQNQIHIIKVTGQKTFFHSIKKDPVNEKERPSISEFQ